MIYTLNNIHDALKSDPITVCYDWGTTYTTYWKVCGNIDIKLSTGDLVTIPNGMPTDFSTVPKLLWSILPPFGSFLFAALLHDYLYIHRPNGITQKAADREMLIWSKKINGNKDYDTFVTYYLKRLGNYIRYYCVRLLGWLYWKKILTFKNKKNE